MVKQLHLPNELHQRKASAQQTIEQIRCVDDLLHNKVS